MNNIRIGVRLGAAFGFILFLLVSIALTGFTRIQSLGDIAETLAGSRYQKSSAAMNLRFYSTDLSRLVLNVIIADDHNRKAGFRQDYDAVRSRMTAAMASLSFSPKFTALAWVLATEAASAPVATAFFSTLGKNLPGWSGFITPERCIVSSAVSASVMLAPL